MIDYLFERLGQLLKLPGALPISALVLLAIGVPRAQRSRRPRLYTAGVITGAVVVVCIWLLPFHLLIWLLPLVAGVLLVFGLPEAHTFRRPERFNIGIIMTAIGLLCFVLLRPVSYFLSRTRISACRCCFWHCSFQCACSQVEWGSLGRQTILPETTLGSFCDE